MVGGAGCGSQPTDDPAENGTTLQAQTKLVSGTQIAAKRVRFRRHIPASDRALVDRRPPYDLAGTAEGVRAVEQAKALADSLRASGWEEKTPAGRMRVTMVDEHNDEWEEEYELEDLRALREFAEARGINRPSLVPNAVVDSELLPGLKAQGWSGGTDARALKPMNATWPANHNVLMRQGQLNFGCTAALVGRRMVLTAAHCVVNSNGSITTGQLYSARRDGSTNPWGIQGTSGSWKDVEYTNNNCHTNYTSSTRETCGKYDWALLRLNSDSWQNGTPGWMGYWVAPASGWFARLDGYPACGFAHSPSACVSNSVYGQDVGHSLFNFRGNVNGELTVFNSANDMSPGHSGGPVWSSSFPDSNGPYVLGIVTNEMCAKCDANEVASADDKKFPAMHRTMTASLAGLITDKRALYP